MFVSLWAVSSGKIMRGPLCVVLGGKARPGFPDKHPAEGLSSISGQEGHRCCRSLINSYTLLKIVVSYKHTDQKIRAARTKPPRSCCFPFATQHVIKEHCCQSFSLRRPRPFLTVHCKRIQICLGPGNVLPYGFRPSRSG